jgi:hypothetical protein
MQDHQKHRPQDDFGRSGQDDGRWEASDRRSDERVSWSEGDGGRTAEAFRNQGQSDRSSAGSRGMGYGGDQQNRYGEGMSTGWTGDRAGGSQGGYGQTHGGGSMYRQNHGQDYGRNQQHGFARGGYDPGYSQGGQFGGSSMGGSNQNQQYGGGQSQQSQSQQGHGYSQHGYAPGSQIWEGSGPGMGGQTHEHHDFEPDYLHWRQQQLSAFDKDYTDWRSERRQKFSSDFDSWRQTRPRSEASGEHRTPAENPIVGDVSDGGVGTQDAKKR